MPNRNRPSPPTLARNALVTLFVGLLFAFTVAASQGPGFATRSALASAFPPSTPACAVVSVPDLTSYNSRDIIIPVNTTDVTGTGALSADLHVSYDPNILLPGTGSNYGVTLGPVAAGRQLTVSNLNPGLLLISVFGASPFQSSGVLLNMQFTVVGVPGDVSPVNFETFKYNEGDPCSTPINGSVTVIAGTITGTINYGNILGPPTVRPISNVAIGVSGAPAVSATPTNASGMYSISGFGPGAYTMTPSKSGNSNGSITAFDSARIAQYVVNLISLTSTQLIVGDVTGNGVVTSFDAALIARFVVFLPDTAATGNWIFSPASTTHTTVYADVMGENYSALLMGDVTGNWNDPTSLPGGRTANSGGPERSTAISAPHLVTPTGNDIVIPIRAEGIANKGIISYEFDLRYDPSVIQPLPDPVDIAGTISNKLSIAVNAEEPGLLRVALYGPTALKGDGDLLNLKFTAIGAPGSISPLSWQRIMLNEGTPRTTAADGEVELSAATTTDQAEISGRVLTAMGQGVPNARVTLADTAGKTRSVVSNSFGVYRFADLQMGQSYTIRVDMKRYRFTPLTVSVTGQLAKIDMIAEQ